ncbi:MAG: hypothetical protein ABI383_04475 [Acidobacteriaceae bacterium]
MIHLELNAEVEARLAAEAEAHGLQTEKYAERLIEEAVESRPGGLHPRATIEEFRAFLDALSSQAPNVANLRRSTFPREMIYAEHD